MTDAVQQILDKADRLTQAERAELVHALIRSLDDGEDADAADLWDAEVARRSAEIREGRAKGRPAEDLFRELSDERS